MMAFWEESWAQFLRWLWHLKRQPMQIAITLTHPLMWLLIFGPAMKGRVSLDGQMDYVAFILPGIITFTVFGNSLMGGIPILFDRESGFLTRLLASPASRGSILFGRAMYTLLLSGVQALIVLFLGVLMSQGLELSVSGVLGMLVIAALLGLGLTAISLGLAFRLKGHGSFFALIGTLSLPLLFLSSALFQTAEMPTWMRYAVLANPMTYAIDGMRASLAGGFAAAPPAVFAALVAFDVVALAWGWRTCSRHMA